MQINENPNLSVPPLKSDISEKLSNYFVRIKVILSTISSYLIPSKQDKPSKIAFKAVLLPVSVTLSPIILIASSVLALKSSAKATVTSHAPQQTANTAISYSADPFKVSSTQSKPLEEVKKAANFNVAERVQAYDQSLLNLYNSAGTPEELKTRPEVLEALKIHENKSLSKEGFSSATLRGLGSVNQTQSGLKIKTKAKQEDHVIQASFDIKGIGKVKLAGVCDGHGEAIADKISKFVANEFPKKLKEKLKSLENSPDLKKNIETVLKQLVGTILTELDLEINQKIKNSQGDQQGPNNIGLLNPDGTTFAVSICISNEAKTGFTAYNFNVGDSLLYAVDEGQGKVYSLNETQDMQTNAHCREVALKSHLAKKSNLATLENLKSKIIDSINVAQTSYFKNNPQALEAFNKAISDAKTPLELVSNLKNFKTENLKNPNDDPTISSATRTLDDLITKLESAINYKKTAFITYLQALENSLPKLESLHRKKELLKEFGEKSLAFQSGLESRFAEAVGAAKQAARQLSPSEYKAIALEVCQEFQGSDKAKNFINNFFANIEKTDKNRERLKAIIQATNESGDILDPSLIERIDANIPQDHPDKKFLREELKAIADHAPSLFSTPTLVDSSLDNKKGLHFSHLETAGSVGAQGSLHEVGFSKHTFSKGTRILALSDFAEEKKSWLTENELASIFLSQKNATSILEAIQGDGIHRSGGDNSAVVCLTP